MSEKTPIGFTRSCWACKKFRVAYGGKLDKRTKLWVCSECSKGTETVEKISWNKGKPAAVGWYRTRGKDFACTGTYRWWDGERWSWPAFEHESAERAGRWAAKKEVTSYFNLLLWSEMP
jgi:hypothetical protein